MTAPSLSSFPPSFSSFPDFDADKTESRDGRHDKDNKKKRKKHEHKKGRHKSTRSRESSPCQEKAREDGAIDDTLDRIFYSDRRGDFLNIQFGGLHVGDVPKYHLVDNTRNILGLSGMVIHRRAAQGVEVGRSGYRRMSSLTDPGTRSLLKKDPERRLKPLSRLEFGNEEDGIIRLPSSKSSKKPEDSYRSITGDPDASDTYTSSSEDEGSISIEDDQPLLTAHQETLKTLEEDIITDPANVDKWLALLHQTLSTTPTTSKNATKVRSEITLSVLSRAMAANPGNTKNKVLRTLYLKACEEVCQEDKLRTEWDETFKDADIEILMEWLEWQIRKGLGGLDGLVTSAVKALSRLEKNSDEDAKLRIFWRIAFAIRSAGYSERAMAMFQTQGELVFNMPPELSTVPFHTRLDKLEEFWDSEVPRLGEDGAKGWKIWYSSKSNQIPPPTPPLHSSRPDLDPFRDWARHEELLDSRVLLPSRSDTDTSDPHSTVLFSDIRPLLLDIRGRRAMEGFRLTWLAFLGLHLPGFRLSASTEMDWDDRWNLEFLTRVPMLNSIFPSDGFHTSLMTDAVAGVIIGRERQHGSPFGPVRCWGRGVCDALDLASAEPGRLQRRGLWSRNDIAEVDSNVVRHIFSSLRMGQDDVEWDSLALAFELVDNPMSTSKKSKEFLLANQDSFGLWCLHAQLERLRGRLDEARKVYQTILISSHIDNSQPYISRMWWNWVEMEWLAGAEGQSLSVILKSVHLEGSNSAVTILRGKRKLDDLVDSTDPANWKDLEACIRMRALLELLTGSPSSAITIVDKYLSGAKCGSFHESLTTFALLMLYYHGVTLRHPMPPSILRGRAHAAFEVYPNNSIILGLLLESEKGQGVWGRLREILGRGDYKAKGVARRIEEVWIAAWENGRWITELERTRNGLAAGVEHERTRSSSIIWRIYIEFEIRGGELQRAKKLLFRAIRECPMVKGIYLLAFGRLRSVFTTHELSALADMMAERGLRLHQGLDEVLGEMVIVEDNIQDGIHDVGGDDEIEHNAKELKRLKPY